MTEILNSTLVETPPDEPTSVLRTHALNRSFGSFQAVADLALDIRQGEIYAFLGRNGAGKTTTIRMLMGIINSDSGQLDFFGHKTKRPSRKQKQSIGYVSQEQFFYPWMTANVIGKFVRGFYPNWDDQEYQRLLEVLDLPDDRKISQLSGGMKVKLALALALAHRPELLILDEPTSGLDPVARLEFRQMILHQARKYGRATFYSTHLIEEVEDTADRVGIIDQGRLLYEGRIDTLKQMIRAWVLSRTDELSMRDQEDLETPTPPPGFSVLKETRNDDEIRWILRAEPEAWNDWHPAQGVVQEQSLEDIFVTLVGGKSRDL